MFLVVILILFIVFLFIVMESHYFMKWLRIIVGAYYLVITTIFITGHHLIHEKYNIYHGPVIHEGWEINSNWAFLFSFAYIIPMVLLVLYTFLHKVKILKGTQKQRTRSILFLVVWTAVLFFLFILFNLAYGLRP